LLQSNVWDPLRNSLYAGIKPTVFRSRKMKRGLKMNDRDIVKKEDIQSVIVDGVNVGFVVKLKIPYYRGVSLSLIDDITVMYDDEVFPRDQLKFTVGGLTHTFAEMATISQLRWEFGEKATVFVPRIGGIALGFHRITVSISIRISYMGEAKPRVIVLENVCPMGG
jgi:hypothetical protein